MPGIKVPPRLTILVDRLLQDESQLKERANREGPTGTALIGRRKFTRGKQYMQQTSFDKSEIECFNCHKKGHYSDECTRKKFVRKNNSTNQKRYSGKSKNNHEENHEKQYKQEKQDHEKCVSFMAHDIFNSSNELVRRLRSVIPYVG